jgi:phage terminase large subunit-like protein
LKRSSRPKARELTPEGEAKYRRVVRFFEGVLRHSKGQHAGDHFKLLPWQHDAFRELFGRLKPDGTRQHRVAYIEVPKKNGKSTLLAGIALYMLLADEEPGAEVYGAACDREQAGIIYREAAAMVRASPALSKVLEVVDSRKTIIHRASNSFYRVLSADAFRAEGLNIHALLFDEMHAQRDRRLYDALRYGGAARRQPLLLSITTAGELDRKALWWEQRTYAERCKADPTLDPAFYGCVYKADEADDPFDEATWRKANPSLGYTITLESFAADALEAKNSPSKLNSFLRYRLDIATSSDVRWILPDKWAACGGALRPLDGRQAYVGLDLSSTTDLTCAVYLFPDEDGTFDVLPFFWAAAENAQGRAHRDKVPYLDWARDKTEYGPLLRLTDGNATDYDTVRRDINEINKRFVIRQMGIDPWNAQHISQQLQGDGFEIVAFRQGYGSFSSPCKFLETLTLSGRLRHANHPMLSWMANNVSIEMNHAGDIKPSKSKSTERIDGMVALVEALGLWQTATAPKPEQNWDIVAI